jgi:flagella basal body P-ring formation protein FlgA
MDIRFTLAAALLAAPVSAAAPFQDLAALESRLVTALGAGIGEPGGPAAPIDRRLMLQRCPKNIVIDPPAMGAVALRCAALGWRIRVALARFATPVAMTARVDPVVRRGDPVDLVADSDGFSVSVSATAQEDGAPGSRIRVRTDGKSQPIYAEVIDAGRVRLPGFK